MLYVEGENPSSEKWEVRDGRREMRCSPGGDSCGFEGAVEETGR